MKPMCMRPPCTNAEVKIRYHCEGWAQMIAGYMQKLPGARAVLMVQSLGAQSPATYTSALSENTNRVPTGSASHQAVTEATGPAFEWMLLCIARRTQPLRIAACASRPQTAPTLPWLRCFASLSSTSAFHYARFQVYGTRTHYWMNFVPSSTPQARAKQTRPASENPLRDFGVRRGKRGW